MSVIKAGNIKKGSYILYNNAPQYVMKTQFVSPGKGSAFTRTKMRNVFNGAVLEFNFKSHDAIEEVEVESREVQFLYSDTSDVVFMDPRTYEQFAVPSAVVGDKVGFLVQGDMKIFLTFYQEKVIGVGLPPKVKMVVKEAQDAVAGDRQTSGKKPVTMETGITVYAPLFVKTGETLLIDTETGEYVSRANS
ncbi:MAG TPA: elongation factor P [Candidatus Pacebacteria bacterium]|nr:elongation factor P [Candidatus Paceibacterota bacterium]